VVLGVSDQAMYDLLAEQPGSGDQLQVVGEGASVAVKGLTWVDVASEEEALAQFFTGGAHVTGSLCHLEFEHQLNCVEWQSAHLANVR
jgi:hypothetical protein